MTNSFLQLEIHCEEKIKKKERTKLLQNGKILHVLLQNLNDFLKIQPVMIELNSFVPLKLVNTNYSSCSLILVY